MDFQDSINRTVIKQIFQHWQVPSSGALVNKASHHKVNKFRITFSKGFEVWKTRHPRVLPNINSSTITQIKSSPSFNNLLLYFNGFPRLGGMLGGFLIHPITLNFVFTYKSSNTQTISIRNHHPGYFGQ